MSENMKLSEVDMLSGETSDRICIIADQLESEYHLTKEIFTEELEQNKAKIEYEVPKTYSDY